MKKLILISIFILCPKLFAQNAHIVIKGGFDYNFITAGAFKRIGYDNNKYLFPGYLVGIGFMGEGVSVDFEYADLKAKVKLNTKDADLKLSIFTISIMAGSPTSYPLAGGIRADLNVGFTSDNVYGSMSIGPEIDFYPIRNIGFFAAGMLNLGVIDQSAKPNEIIESSIGLSTGPEIKTGIKIVF
jgi:hypothetical protein